MGEFLDGFRLLFESIFRLDMFKSHRDHVKCFFKDPILVQLMEWPVLFLGGAPDGVPALYSLMDHASCALGTWYPEGGLNAPIAAMHAVALELGVEVKLNSEVTKIRVDEQGLATGVEVSPGRAGESGMEGTYNRCELLPEEQEEKEYDDFYAADVVVATGDYQWIEQQLLPPQHRRYTEKYWDQRVMSPSSLLYYLGISKDYPISSITTSSLTNHWTTMLSRSTPSQRGPRNPSFTYVSHPSQTLMPHPRATRTSSCWCPLRLGWRTPTRCVRTAIRW